MENGLVNMLQMKIMNDGETEGGGRERKRNREVRGKQAGDRRREALELTAGMNMNMHIIAIVIVNCRERMP